MAKLMALLTFLFTVLLNAQTPNEIPLERCDRLAVVRVEIDNSEMRFLLDSGATTILNVHSFKGTRDSTLKIHAWNGNVATSAREVAISSLKLGRHEVRNLKLPAVDLSPIGKACGGEIDGLFGVDLMEAMGLKLDFERRLATFKPSRSDARQLFSELEASLAPCKIAFEQADERTFKDCLDPEIVLYTQQGEYRGPAQVVAYMRNRYFQYGPHLMYDTVVRDVQLFGDALWYSYDFFLDTPKEHTVGHGMSMCRKTGGRWRILNMHQSHGEQH
jgi:Aspartyl protease/SnoaL-like domain